MFSFFAGGGAVKFVKDYAAAGLKDKIPLYGTGFLTDGTLEAPGRGGERHQDHAALRRQPRQPGQQGLPRRLQEAKTNLDGDVYAVQGYDSAALLDIGLEAVGGDVGARDKMIAAMEGREDRQPRGPISFSKAHNVDAEHLSARGRKGRNEYVSVAHANLADPARGCRMTA